MHTSQRQQVFHRTTYRIPSERVVLKTSCNVAGRPSACRRVATDMHANDKEHTDVPMCERGT